MAGYLTTHVLDTARGRPAEDLRIVLHRLEGEGRVAVGEARTNADGRTDRPILAEGDFRAGTYELLFHCGPYLARHHGVSEGAGFLDLVPLRFGMREQAHYHVPLLLSPFGYTTYRGS